MYRTRKQPVFEPLALAGVLGLAVVLAGCSQSASEAASDGRDLATRFLDDLRAGQVQAAWERTSTDFKSLMGLESLRDYVKTHPALKGPAEFSGSRPVERNGIALTEYEFRATPPQTSRRKAASASPATVKLLVIQQAEGPVIELLSVE